MENSLYLIFSVLLLIHVLASNAMRKAKLRFYHESTFATVLGLLVGFCFYFVGSIVLFVEEWHVRR
jgi:hypothetical protein